MIVGVDMAKPRVLITAPIHSVAIDILSKHAEVFVNDKILDEDDMIKLVKEIDPMAVIAVRGTDPVTRKVIENNPRLLVVVRHGVGYDKVDVTAATEFGVWVAITPVRELSLAVAEHAIALIMCLVRKICLADKALRDGVWNPELRNVVLLEDKILGVIGLGRIGTEIARKAKGLGMKVVYYDIIRKRDIEEKLGVQYMDLNELLRVSDFVVIAVPLTKETMGLIKEKELRLMKKTAYIINIARGGIIDHESLIKILRENQIAGAALDVFPVEPLPKDDPVLKLEDTVLTPHTAWLAEETKIALARAVAEEVTRVLRCEDPLNPVNPEVKEKARKKCKNIIFS